MAYEGSVELISGIKQANNGTFPLVDASAVRIDDETRLSEFAEDVGANKADKNNPVLTGAVDGSDVTKVFVGSGAVNPGTYGTAFGVNNYYYFDPQHMVQIPEWVAGTHYKKGAIVKIPQDMSVNPPFYNFYICTYQNTDSTFNEMHWRLLENRPAPSFAPHAFVVGNGFQDEGEVGGYGSNALTVDWTGDTHVMGDVYVGADADGSGGSKVLVSNDVSDLRQQVADNADEIGTLKPAATASDIGKALIVKTVENGKPTSFEYGDSGGAEIDDTAGNGDTDKVWSADKTVKLQSDIGVLSSLNTTNKGNLVDAVNEVRSNANNKVSEPVSEGTAGSVLTSDGNGGRSWAQMSSIEGADVTIVGNKLVIQGSGGHGSYGTWTLVKNYTHAADGVIDITTDDNGDALALTSARVLITVPANVTYSTSCNFEAYCNSSKFGGAYSAAKTGSSDARLAFDILPDHGYWDFIIRGTMTTDGYIGMRAGVHDTYQFMKWSVTSYPTITKIMSDKSLPAGITVKIWEIQ